MKCPACLHQDWCLVNDGGTEYLCMRVVSDKPLRMKDGTTGYVHLPSDATFIVPPLVKQPVKREVDVGKYWGSLVREQNPQRIEELAKRINVSYSSLLDLQVRWDIMRQAWAFPMFNGYQVMVGISHRYKSSEKKTMGGTHMGLFIPLSLAPHKRLYITEGGSDTAVALTFGMNAVGRPSAKSGLFDLVTLCSRVRPKEVVIICDSDGVGLEGAETLAKELGVRNCTITLPCKDLRKFADQGGNARHLEAMTASMIWTQPHKL